MHLFAWSWIILVVQLLCESIPYEKHWSNIFYFKMLIYLCSCKYHRLLIYKLTKVFKNVINSHMKALPRSLTNFENLQQSGWSQETRKGTTKCGDERRCKRRYRWICQLLTFWCKVSNWQIQHFFFLSVFKDLYGVNSVQFDCSPAQSWARVWVLLWSPSSQAPQSVWQLSVLQYIVADSQSREDPCSHCQ